MVTFQITDTATGTVLLEKQVDSKELGAHSDELTVEKSLPIGGLPRQVQVTVKINDAISKQEIAPIGTFCRGIGSTPPVMSSRTPDPAS